MLKRILFMVLIPSLISISSLTQAAPCPTYNGCAKFDIPGAFPGDFYIDFTGTSMTWRSVFSGDIEGGLSTSSQIDFSVGDPIEGTDEFGITVLADDFQFEGVETDSLGMNVWGAGTGTGSIDIMTGDWELLMPVLIAVPMSSTSPLSFWAVGDLLFSTANPGGSAMILDPNNTDWGKLTIASNTLYNSTSYNQQIIDDIFAENTSLAMSRDFGSYTPESSNIEFDFVIEGIDPVSEVPVPAAGWFFATSMMILFGKKRKNLSA